MSTTHAYAPIADYALLGDGHTAALVSRDGSIDWLAWPDFDSPGLFAALLDARHGGSFRVGLIGSGGGSRGDGATHRHYRPGTNVLDTHFDTPRGSATLTDFLAVVAPPEGGTTILPRRALVRLLRGTGGRAELEIVCAPRPHFGKHPVSFEQLSAHCIAIRGAGHPLALHASVPLAIRDHSLVGQVALAQGEDAWFILVGNEDAIEERFGDALGGGHAGLGLGRKLLDETEAFWRSWSSRLDYHGPHREHVERSALTLKALIYAPTGALVAAPTTSLPERPGGVRNWDYRFTWVRDATLSLAALYDIGYTDEAEAFFRFFFDTAHAADPARLRTLYTIRGTRCAPERELPHLEGYRGSRPVRIGNDAADQLQLDVYGELVDAFYTFRDHLVTEREDLAHCYNVVDWVAANWRLPDRGIWEVRGAARPFVHSRAVCWQALDRGIKLAEAAWTHGDGASGGQERSKDSSFRRCVRSYCGPPPDVERWRRERDAVRAEVLDRGYDAKLGAFVQAYDHPVLDASALRLPIIGFIDARDPRMVSTVERIRRDLSRHGLVYRYLDADDGLPRGESTFALCTFWQVEVLVMQGRVDEAAALFRRALSYSNDVGLLAEEIDPQGGEQWGNFPQAFAHLGVIRAAVRLAKRGFLRPTGQPTERDQPVDEPDDG